MLNSIRKVLITISIGITGWGRKVKNRWYSWITLRKAGAEIIQYLVIFNMSLNKWALHISVKTRCRSLWREPSVLRNMLAFSFNLAYKIPDNAAYMSAMLLCVQPLPEKSLYLLLKRHLVAEREIAFSVCLPYCQINTNIDPCFNAATIVLNVKMYYAF